MIKLRKYLTNEKIQEAQRIALTFAANSNKQFQRKSKISFEKDFEVKNVFSLYSTNIFNRRSAYTLDLYKPGIFSNFLFFGSKEGKSIYTIGSVYDSNIQFPNKQLIEFPCLFFHEIIELWVFELGYKHPHVIADRLEKENYSKQYKEAKKSLQYFSLLNNEKLEQ